MYQIREVDEGCFPPDLYFHTLSMPIVASKSPESQFFINYHQWYDASEHKSAYDGVHAVVLEYRKAIDSLADVTLLTKASESFWTRTKLSLK